MGLQTTPMIEQALARFSPADAVIAQMKREFAGLTVRGLDDKAGFERVHDARMAVVRHRVQVEKTRKDLKADSLEYGRRVDVEAKRLTASLLEIEGPLDAEENKIVAEKARIQREAQELAEAARKAKLDARISRLQKIGASQIVVSAIESMSDTDFDAEAARCEAAEDARIARLEQESLERAEREAAEALLRQQQEVAARDAQRIEAERIAQERAAAEVQRQANAETQRKLAEERAQIERERAAIDAEKAKAAQAEAAKRAAKEAKERAKAEAERLAALAPDLEKIDAYCTEIEAIAVPIVFCSAAIRASVDAALAGIRGMRP